MTKEDLMGVQSFETEGDYRASPSLNYSLIKNLVDGPRALVEERSLGSSTALNVGNFVDKYFTDKDHLYDIYAIGSRKIELTESWESVYARLIELEEWEPTQDRIVEICRELGLFVKMGEDVIKTRIPSLLQDKLTITKNNNGKILLTEEEYSQTMRSIENIEKDPESIDLITAKEGEIILHQYKLEFPLVLDSGRTRMFKAMLDFIKINLLTLEMFGIDLKTGKRYSHKFYDQFVEYRYDIQGILYYWALLALRRIIIERFGIILNVPPPEHFKFLYSPKMQNKLPIIVAMDEPWIKANGGDFLKHKGTYYPGCWKLMNEADWYLEAQEFGNHKIVAEKRVHTISQLSNYTV